MCNVVELEVATTKTHVCDDNQVLQKDISNVKLY